MERTEWPTEEYVAKLRQSGIIPYSRTAARLIMAVLLIFVSALFFRQFKSFISAYLAGVESEQLVLSRLAALAQSWVEPLVLLNCAVFAVVLFFGLLQTRFLILPGQVKLDPARLGQTGAAGVIIRLLASLFWWLTAVLAAFLSFRWFAPTILPLLEMRRALVWGESGKILEAVLPMALVILAGWALVAWLAARFLFMFGHRMSREDVLKNQSSDA